MISCKNSIVLRNITFVRKLHLERRTLNSEMVNRNVLITFIMPKNENPVPVVLKSSMIMLSPEQSFSLVNGFQKKSTIGDTFDKYSRIKNKAIYNEFLQSLRCMDKSSVQHPFIAESLDESSKDQCDVGLSLGEESSDWDEEDEYEDEEDDQ